MMCTNCGEFNFDDEKYCECCGAQLRTYDEIPDEIDEDETPKATFPNLVTGFVLLVSGASLMLFSSLGGII